MLVLTTALAAGAVALTSMSSYFADDLKIGFVVKQPEQPWFIDERGFADISAEEKGLNPVKIAAQDDKKVQAALDNLGAQDVQSVDICTPDVKLGPRIVAKAALLEDLADIGITTTKIGEDVGSTSAAEIAKHGWDWKDVRAMRVFYDQLPTALHRVNGTFSKLAETGLLEINTIDAPQAKTDTEAAPNALTVVLNKKPEIKYWGADGLNDEVALDAVRAAKAPESTRPASQAVFACPRLPIPNRSLHGTIYQFQHHFQVTVRREGAVGHVFRRGPGTVHGIMGENGAGKPTLILILSCDQPANEGTIHLDGVAQKYVSAHEAFDADLIVVHQKLQLVPELTVAENLWLVRFPNRDGVDNLRSSTIAARG